MRVLEEEATKTLKYIISLIIEPTEVIKIDRAAVHLAAWEM
jgi:hypothetical protein